MRRWGLLLLLVSLCTGCGIQNEAGDTTNPTASSGSAGTVSVHIAEASERNPLCNGNNYYESVYDEKTDDWTICQMNMDGTTRREFPMKEYGELAYVREDELFYLKQNDRLGASEMWRVPIQHLDSGDTPQFEKAKKLLTEESDTMIHSDCVYADDQYIMYITDNYDLRAYDRRAGKQLPIQDVADKKGFASNPESARESMIGDTVFIHCKYNGLYSYTLGDKKLKQINKRTHGAYSVLVCPEQNLVLYVDCKNCDGENHGDVVLCIYDCETGEKKEFMTGEQWKQAYQSAGVWEEYQKHWCEEEKEYMEWQEERGKEPKPEDAPLPEPAYFIDGTCLYSIEEGIVLSLDLAGDRTPHYEKDLSDCLRTLKYDFYDISKIDQGVCYFEHEEEEEEEEDDIYGYYDLTEKKYVQTKVEGDEE